MKKWHLSLNGEFQGYAPNRQKARGWATAGGTVVAETKQEILVIRGNDKYQAVYKALDA